MSVKAMAWAMRLPVKPCQKKAVLMVLADFATDTGKSYPQLKTFTRDSGLGADAVRTQLAALCEEGVITDTGLRVGDLKDVAVFQLNPVKELELKPAQPKPRKKLKNEALEEADKIYQMYPRRVGRPKALTSIARCIKTYGFEVVFNGTKVFSDAWNTSGRTDITFCPHPATFFNQERFNDDPATWGFDIKRKILAGPASNGPSMKDVMEYVKEKYGNESQFADWALGFFGYWTKRQWKQGQSVIDWKIKLGEHISQARQAAEKAKTFDWKGMVK